MGDQSKIKHISYWNDSVQPIYYNRAVEDQSTDAVIVGGGIAGISVAYKLCKAGLKVVVIEDGSIGSGETGYTTAHLTNALDDRYFELEDIFGKEETKLIAESHTEAINSIEENVRIENIDCDFSRLNGYLFLHPSDEADSLDKELEAAARAGLQVKMLDSIPGFPKMNGKCIEFSNQAQIHSLKYLDGLCKAITAMGGNIYTDTHAKEISEKGIVTDEGVTINAKYIVVATNTPVNNKVVMHLKQFAYRSYVIGVLVKKGSIKQALWWDTGDHIANKRIPPYHYIRLHSYDDDYDVLICGGEDHATGLTESQNIKEEDRYAAIESWLRERADFEKVIYNWSGQIMEPLDGMAYIGRNPMDKKNVFIVTGDSGNGMTHGALAGLIITDQINGGKNKYEKIYDPSRIKITKTAGFFLSEFTQGLVDYIKTSPDAASAEQLAQLKNGEACITKLNGRKHGVFKDDDGVYHVVSAICPHLQCIVKWNSDEKSWDCPCHGSRFTYKGEVINGPANSNLDYHSDKISSNA